jgi:hypothetical protein
MTENNGCEICVPQSVLLVGLVIKHKGGKPGMSSYVATYVPSFLGIVGVVSLPQV